VHAASLDTIVEQANGGIDTVISGEVSAALADNVENLVLSLALTNGIETRGTGNALANVITGNAGRNFLEGGAGDDTLIGGAGNDDYRLGAGDGKDKIVEQANGGTQDFVESALAKYTLAANLEGLILAGGAGDISGTGNALGNQVSGNEGNNTVDGGGGDDSVNGGDGNDQVLGGSGDDSLSGNGGNDVLKGGTGNDVYQFVDDTDQIVEDRNGGIDTIFGRVSLFDMTKSGQNVENLLFNLTNNETDVFGIGNNLDNRIQGVFGDDALVGNEGNDLLIASKGDDSLEGDAGNDTLLGGEGKDRLAGGNGDDHLDFIIFSNGQLDTATASGVDEMLGGAGNDIYLVDNVEDQVFEAAGEGKDVVFALRSYGLGAGQEIEALTLLGTDNTQAIGNEFANTLTGNSGNNFLLGGGGNDTLIGGAGDDGYSLQAGDDHDKIVEAANGGIDTVSSGLDHVTLGANLENLVLTGIAVSGTGNGLANVITGDNIANRLDGGAGNDTLIGGNGQDTLKGGAGDDVFLYQLDNKAQLAGIAGDTITDFKTGHDKIDLSDIFAEFGLDHGGDPIADGHLLLVKDGKNTLVEFDADGAGGGAAVTIATVIGVAVGAGDVIH
jgi:Ca2+-binding RTX toxin-like protein